MSLVVKNEEFQIFNRSAERVARVMRENLGESGSLSMSNFDRVTIPAAGGLSWSIPSLNGEESARELIGIVLFWKPTRAFWREEFGGKAVAPDCRSDDGITGIGTPGGRCDLCEYSQWESDPKGGRGQWCKAMKQMFVLRPTTLMPLILTVPPTSIKVVDQFFYRLMSEAIAYYEVVVSLKLEKISTGDVPAYSRIVMSLAGQLDDNQINAVSSIRDSLMPVFKRVRAVAEVEKEGAEVEKEEADL